MIQIHRTEPAPTPLRSLGLRQTMRDCDAYERDPEGYKSGLQHFPSKKYYSRKAVKDVLAKMHHNKCCYCETRLPTPGYLHVEHFRPKTAVRQSLADTNEHPGYYWLAYCWENLLLACPECNSTHKGTVFPLENPTHRARSHSDDLSRERHRFVNPTTEDPREHIYFEDDLPVARSERGWYTIEGLGLRRDPLTQQRFEWLEIIRTYIRMVSVSSALDRQELKNLEAEARRFLAEAMQPEAKFSSMVVDCLARNGLVGGVNQLGD